AVRAMARIGCESGENVVPLRQLLADPSEVVRWHTLLGLAEFGPPARSALPQVRQLLQDSNSTVRFSALVFFEKVLSDEEFSAVRDEVARAAQDGDLTVRQVAQSLLSKRSHDEPENMPGG